MTVKEKIEKIPENYKKYQENLLVKEPVRPCDRVINGHRLVAKLSPNGFWFWTTRPNRSQLTFCFAKLSSADAFCKQYVNEHSEKFWFNLWHGNLFYSEKAVLKYVSPLSVGL